jgi:hypothetical protein
VTQTRTHSLPSAESVARAISPRGWSEVEMEVREKTTLEAIRRERPTMIFYSFITPWWTHRPCDLGVKDSGLPCGPRGSILLQTDDVEGFLRAAEANPEHYGRHGLRSFIAAHNDNAIRSLEDPRPWEEKGWEPYNEALDRLDKRLAEKLERGET